MKRKEKIQKEGWELIKKINSRSKWKSWKVVVVTSHCIQTHALWVLDSRRISVKSTKCTRHILSIDPIIDLDWVKLSEKNRFRNQLAFWAQSEIDQINTWLRLLRWWWWSDFRHRNRIKVTMASHCNCRKGDFRKK